MNQTANRFLGEAPLGKLMRNFSIPCILSLLIASLYNMVDQVFIGRGVGYLGNGATNVVFPITVIALAVALLVGDGCAAYLSLCLGKGENEKGRRAVGTSVVLLVTAGVVMTVLFALLKEKILWGFGATENNIEFAREYFDFLLPGIPFYVVGNGLGSVIRADGSPKFAMLSTVVGCVLNLILDPIAIFGLGWGMMGAALATITGQIVTAILGLWYLTRTKSVTLTKSSFRPSGEAARNLLPLGVSSLLTQVAIVVIMAVMNNCLVLYGAQSVYGADIPLTVVGIVMKVFQLVIAFVVGIAAGCQPIVGYNFGAGNIQRVRTLFRKMMIAELVVGAVSLLIFQCFPLQIISIFGSGDALYNEFAGMAFRIYLAGIILCCIQKSCSIFLQALGKPVMSMALSLLRDFVLIVPFTLLLSKEMGVVGALWSAPLADIGAFVVTVLLMVHTFRSVLGMKKETKLQTAN